MNATVDLHSSDVSKHIMEKTINSTWKVSVLQDHYDDERDKIVFYKITPDLQDQDHSVQDQDQDRFLFGLRPVLF